MSFMESMGIMTSDGVYELLENGVYSAKLTSIVPYQRAKYQNPNEMENALKWIFETTTEKTTKDTPFKISYLTSAYYTTSSKNRIRPLVQAIFGKILSVNEFKELEENQLIGQELQIIVKQNPSAKDPNKIYNNITEFLPRAKKTQPFYNGTTKTTQPPQPDKITPDTIESVNWLREELKMTPRAFYEFISEQLQKRVSNIVNITEKEGKQIFYLLEAMLPQKDEPEEKKELPAETKLEEADLDTEDVPF